MQPGVKFRDIYIYIWMCIFDITIISFFLRRNNIQKIKNNISITFITNSACYYDNSAHFSSNGWETRMLVCLWEYILFLGQTEISVTVSNLFFILKKRYSYVENNWIVFPKRLFKYESDLTVHSSRKWYSRNIRYRSKFRLCIQW